MSTGQLILLLLLLTGAGAYVLRYLTRKRRRRRLLASHLSDRQRAIVEKAVPIVRKLPPELRRKLEGKIRLFLHQISFVGLGELEMTDDIRLSVAAQACLLVVNTDTWYENLYTVLVYPDAFTSRLKEQDGYVVTERNVGRLGESWSRGPVVLSWADVEHGAADTRDGQNVVFHEFAHQIDDLSGHTNAIPILAKGQKFVDWERAFVTAYDRHVRNVEHGARTVFDAYGATSHVEFFAVAVEVFFERPAALKHEAPDVYTQLAILFRLDPVSWA
ncbi:M90 family metallopeptidase [Oricola sp.]|uniref:M90 family metallopeptidase n=1 Tax=Oricola sp. TaxID=1979950 RepID=UPI0025D02E76|nr:M90 family metallopeptidase [Oricola sp.]MCI5074390.1 zinc-dependent peptidase [Oricola sp.]